MARRSNDPIKTAARTSRAQRRVGQGATCSQCGEARTKFLVARSRPRRCRPCYALAHGKKPTEAHHVAGKANSPVTVELPVNDHRSLSDTQYEWPPQTLRNIDGSPLLAAAGALRGTADFLEELVVGLIRWCADLLERLDAWLRGKYGQWWKDTPFDGWQPK